MTKIDELRARAEAIEAELRTIHTEAGDANLNDDQNTRWAALETEEREIREAIAHHEAIAARDAATAERRARWGSVQVTPTRVDPFDLATIRHADPQTLVERAHQAFETPRRGQDPKAVEELLRKIDRLNDASMDADDERNQGADLARYAIVHGSDAYRTAFKAWFRAGVKGLSPVLSPEEAVAVRASMSLTSANGGYALPTLLDPSLIPTGVAVQNPVRRIARVETGMANVWNGVTISNVTTAWKGEGSAFTDGSPTTGGVSVTAAALTAYVTASFEIFQDSDLLAQLPAVIGQSIDYAEGAAFLTGSGSTAPKGVITAVSGTAGSLVTATTRGTFDSTSFVDTLAMVNATAVRYEDSSSWITNKTTHNKMKQQYSGTSGVTLVEMTTSNEILGSPVYRSSTITATTTSGNILAVLGDFSQYIVYDRLGVNVEFIPNVVDGSGIPTGQRGLVAYKRVGGDVSDVNAFRLLKA